MTDEQCVQSGSALQRLFALARFCEWGQASELVDRTAGKLVDDWIDFIKWSSLVQMAHDL